MIDTHCHLTYEGLAERVDAVVADAKAAGVDRMVSVGTTPTDAERAWALTERFDGVFATAGVHPHYAGKIEDLGTLKAQLRNLLAREGVVAIGEMGLDYFYDEPAKDAQQAVFEAQLELMAQPECSHLPGVIHNREATDDTLATIAASGVAGERFVFHCFTGQPEEVERILETGATVGFTGIVTFGSTKNVAEASDLVPLDRLFIETDSPYLTPAPHRKVRPNEPKYVIHVAAFLAQRRGMSVDELTAATDANAERFYGLPLPD